MINYDVIKDRYKKPLKKAKQRKRYRLTASRKESLKVLGVFLAGCFALWLLAAGGALLADMLTGYADRLTDAVCGG